MYTEAECPKVENWHLCIEDKNSRLSNQEDCVHELITTQSVKDRCNATSIELRRPAMEQLDDRSYLVSFPQSTKVLLSCEGEEYNQLKGSYLVTLPPSCFLHTEEFTITNEQDKVEGQPLKLKKINYNITQTPASASRLQINSINLKSLHDIQDKMMLQAPVETSEDLPVIYYTIIPAYILVFAIVIIGVTILMLRRRSRLQITNKPLNQKSQYEDIEKSQDARSSSAIFSKRI